MVLSGPATVEPEKNFVVDAQTLKRFASNCSLSAKGAKECAYLISGAKDPALY